jgi:hypothetical protein
MDSLIVSLNRDIHVCHLRVSSFPCPDLSPQSRRGHWQSISGATARLEYMSGLALTRRGG